MKVIQHLYQEFKQYFDLSIKIIDNEYLTADAIYINDRYIISTFDFEVANITSYIDCKSLFINHIIHNYLIHKDQLADNELRFIDIYYKYAYLSALKELCQMLPNDKYHSYLLLQQL